MIGNLSMKKLVLLVLIFIIVAGFVSIVYADENTTYGFNEIRLENEFKLDVPAKIVENVRDYLYETYITEQAKILGQGFTTNYSQEYFIDRYFDSLRFDFLKMNNGLRHRTRFLDLNSGPEKQLVQFKLSDNDSLTRQEIKFDVNKQFVNGNALNIHPFWSLIKTNDIQAVTDELTHLNVNPLDLKEVLVIKQNRSRFYLQQPSQGFVATITLDETTSKKFWMKEKFYEIELELSEITYTASTAKHRAEMQKKTEKIKKDLIEKFPDITQDQKPKYTKMFEKLQKKFLFPFLFKWFVNNF